MSRGYRDHEAAREQRLIALEREISALEAGITADFWAAVPAELARERAEILGRRAVAAFSPSSPADSIVTREAYLSFLERVLAKFAAIEASWQALPTTVGLPEITGALSWMVPPPQSAPAVQFLERALLDAVSGLTTNPECIVVGERARAVRFDLAGAPVVVLVQIHPEGIAHSTMIAVSTSARPGAPELAAMPHVVNRAFAATLSISNSAATLRWSADLDRDSIEAAVRELLSVRLASATRPLRR